MKRRKLPAYGRDLKRARNAGQHPDRVWVLCGDDWNRRPQNEPSVCVEPDYRLDHYDWSIMAGLPVHVVERGDVSTVRLAAEIAIYAAPVVVHWRSIEDDVDAIAGRPLAQDIETIAFCHRKAVDGVIDWPEWWPAMLRDSYKQRREAWYSALLSEVERTSRSVG